MSYTKRVFEKELASPPSFIKANLHYEVIMGSYAYGCQDEGSSDIDIYGWCMPQKDIIFPHLSGHIMGFGKKPATFEQWDEKHIIDKERNLEYDFAIYNIVKYFNLVMENNPNMIDSLFVPSRCVTHITNVGNMVREARHDFLHKGCWPKFKGYSYSQMHKAKSKTRESSKRLELIEKYGYDVKFAYHVVRLMDEVRQILATEDLILDQNREKLKSIRRGEWKLEDIEEYFTKMEKELETLYNNSKLPWGPDEEKIKQLLLNCIEEHYGDLSKAIHVVGKESVILKQIKELIEKAGV